MSVFRWCAFLCGTALTVALFIACGSPVASRAAQGLTLTVTPPLIQVVLEPGQSWSSSIDVVNNNPYSITVYAEAVAFEPEGEAGKPKFLLDGDPQGGASLAHWVLLPQDAHEVAAEATAHVPFTITVPHDASPGGHYAAILLGNRAPLGSPGEESALSVTSSIASLLLLTVAGEIVEEGRIRDFVSERTVYAKPEARFSLRFENEGNVHLQPKGDITVFNMFGKKRGFLTINQGEHFGNVLPGSIRKFAFSWESDTGIWDIGRYRAEATLSYGRDVKHQALATSYFYVLPIVPLLEVLGSVLAFVLFMGWAIRAYIRKALALATLRSPASEAPPREGTLQESIQVPVRAVRPSSVELATLLRPLEAGMVDLRRAVVSPGGTPKTASASPHGTIHFLHQYRYFFLFVLVCALVWFVGRILFGDVLTYERPYDVKVEKID